MARIVQELAAPFGVEYGDDDGKTKNNEISGSGQEGKKALFSGNVPFSRRSQLHSNAANTLIIPGIEDLSIHTKSLTVAAHVYRSIFSGGNRIAIIEYGLFYG